jgi:hypothetical protein
VLWVVESGVREGIVHSPARGGEDVSLEFCRVGLEVFLSSFREARLRWVCKTMGAFI